MKSIFICSIKLIGFPFAVLTKEEAEAWVKQDPEMNYYNEVQIEEMEYE